MKSLHHLLLLLILCLVVFLRVEAQDNEELVVVPEIPEDVVLVDEDSSFHPPGDTEYNIVNEHAKEHAHHEGQYNIKGEHAKDHAHHEKVEETYSTQPHQAQIAIPEVRVRTIGTDGSAVDTQRASYPNKVKDMDVVAQGGVKVGFKVVDASLEDKPNMPVNQAMLVLKHVETGRETTFVAKPTKTNQYSVDIDFKSPQVLDAIKYYPGKYDISLYAGAFDTPNSISYPVGSINLNLPGPKQPGYIRPGLSRAGKAGPGAPDPKEFAAQPEIKHVFRQPDKHAPAFVSNVFALATLAPWLILLLGWSKAGANVDMLFKSGGYASTNQLTFAGLILTLPLLMWFYWTRWNLFQLFKWLTLWVVLVVFFGQKALRERNGWQGKRTKGSKSE